MTYQISRAAASLAAVQAAIDAANAARDEALAAVAGDAIIVDTKANLDLNTTALMGQVVSDGTNNGTYGRTVPDNPATAWLRWTTATVPGLATTKADKALVATQAGGVNLATATTTTGTWTNDIGRLLVYRPANTNTSTTVGLAVDGQTSLRLKTSDGTDPPIGSVVAGRPLLLMVTAGPVFTVLGLGSSNPADSSREILPLTSPGGTATAYTASAIRTPLNGNWLVWVPQADSGASPTLNVNSEGAKSLLRRKGGAVGAGDLKASTYYLLYRTGGSYMVWDSINTPVLTLAGFAGSGTAYTANLPAGQNLVDNSWVMFKPHVANAGACTLTAGATVMQIKTQDGFDPKPGVLGKFNYYTGLYSSGLLYLFGVTNNSAPNEVDRAAIEMARIQSQRSFALQDAPGGFLPIVVNGNPLDTWCASMGDQGRLIYVTIAGGFVDFQLMQLGDPVPARVRTITSGSATLYCGKGNTWLGHSGTTLSLGAGGYVRVSRVDTTVFSVEVIAGTLTEVGSPAPPARDITLITAGQSLGVRFMVGAGLSGFQTAVAKFGWSAVTSVWPIQGATGSSALLKTGSANLYWWDHETQAPGPMATAWKTALDGRPAGQPLPAAIIWVFEQTDADFVGETAEYTVASYYSNLAALFAWMRAQTGENTPILISPLGSKEDNAEPTDYDASAMRYIDLAMIAADQYTHLGAAIYDLVHPYYNPHMELGPGAIHGFRTGALLHNLLGGGTHPVGPTVAAIEELDSGMRYRVSFNVSAGYTGFTRPDNPDFFGVLAAGTTPEDGQVATIVQKYWELLGNGLWAINLVLASASPGATVMYPWGCLNTVWSGRYPHDSLNTPVSVGWGNHLPLREFAGSAGAPPVPPSISP